MELKLNKMNKALFRDRAKKLMLTGALAGVIAGVAITSGISSITLKKAEKKLEISNAKLQEQTKKTKNGLREQHGQPTVYYFRDGNRYIVYKNNE